MSRDDVETDSAEEAFDAYLDAALSGGAEPPEEFLARHPDADPALRARIHAIHAELSTRPPAESAPDGERRIGEFRLLRRLGEGGMGVVWEAEQESLGRHVALKVLRADLDRSPEAVERFRRESRTLAQLDHPGIVGVIAAGEDGEARYLAMDLVEGAGLDALLRDATGPFETPRVLGWGARLARALAYAHEHGVIHRDVKPSNVLVGEDDRALLVDFGIARADAASLPTLTGPFVGSPAYAPPEQLTGDRVDGRADVYSLAATLYQCLTGVSAFAGATVDQVIHQVLNVVPPPPSTRVPGLSRDVDVVLAKALAKLPERRYATAAAFAADLEALLAFRPVSARPPSVTERVRGWARRHPASAGALVTLVLGIVVVTGIVAAQVLGDRLERRRAAEVAVADAGERFAAYRDRREDVAVLAERVRWQRGLLESQFLADAEIAKLDTAERELDELRLEQGTMFDEVLSLLRDAERLDPDVAGAARVRAMLYAEKHREAVAQLDERSAAFYADLVADAEPDGPLAVEARGLGGVKFTSDPTGADVFLFRFRELADLVPGGERRLVPVAAGQQASSPAPDEAFTLGGQSRVGVAPITADGLPRGEYMAIATLDGHVTARRLFRVQPNAHEVVRLTLPETSVPGCALIPAPMENEGDESFWIMRREVTSAEYLEFLNDPQTLAEIAASSRAVRAPRAAENVADGGYWPRDAAGAYSLAADWLPDWPVLGVSWDDAVAYAAWRSARDDRFLYRLPTIGEALAAAGEPFRRYPFGMHFRPRFASSCYASEQPTPEPVMSYPIDVSPYGVHDLAGSASEWCDAWYDERRGLRRANFGNWSEGVADSFRIWAARGWPSDAGNGAVGFRLVLEPR